MQAVILSAGEGTRMRPLSFTRPKVMLPVANKPILHHLIDNLSKAGIEEVILVVGYREKTIRDYFGTEFNGVRVRYARQNPQLGTAHALKSARHLLGDRFLMLNGDAIVDFGDLKRLIKEENNVIAVKRVENPWDYGVVVLEDGYVSKIIEKPKKPVSNLINAGIYVFSGKIAEYLDMTRLSARGEYEITDTISIAVKDGVRFKAIAIGEWIDVGYPWDMLEANRIMLERCEGGVEGEVEEGAILRGKVMVGEGTLIRAGSYIIGPVMIGSNCEIGPNCYIRPYTSIGDDCHIGSSVEIKNSIIMNRTKIPHHNYVGDSVIGENCNLGAGTKIANLRLDEKSIAVHIKNRMIDTGRKKLGAIIGDDVKTGINACINVGSLIGNGVYIGPGAVADGYVEPYSRVY